MAEDVFLMSDVFNSDSYGFLETETWSLSVADNMFELMNFKVSGNSSLVDTLID